MKEYKPIELKSRDVNAVKLKQQVVSLERINQLSMPKSRLLIPEVKKKDGIQVEKKHKLNALYLRSSKIKNGREDP